MVGDGFIDAGIVDQHVDAAAEPLKRRFPDALRCRRVGQFAGDQLVAAAARMAGDIMQEDYPERDDKNWMKHTVAWFDGRGAAKGKAGGGSVKIDYRPVHEFTLTDDIEYIKPKPRVY